MSEWWGQWKSNSSVLSSTWNITWSWNWSHLIHLDFQTSGQLTEPRHGYQLCFDLQPFYFCLSIMKTTKPPPVPVSTFTNKRLLSLCLSHTAIKAYLSTQNEVSDYSDWNQEAPLSDNPMRHFSLNLQPTAPNTARQTGYNRWILRGWSPSQDSLHTSNESKQHQQRSTTQTALCLSSV